MADAAPRRRRPGLHGLRPRLVLAFVLVAVITGLAALLVAFVAFVLYRDTVLFGARVRDPNDLLYLLTGTMVGLLTFTVGLALLAARRVLRPVRRLANAADRMARGELGIRLTVTGADEMSDLVHTFNEMASSLGRNIDELRRLEAQSRRFVADVSHELRTPLAAMTAVADLLDDEADSLDGNAAAAARLVSRETRNLNRLVDDLIEISRFDARTATLRLDDIDIVGAVHSCLDLRHWGDRVDLDLPSELVARLDPRRFDVVLANLVGNALRHGAPPVAVRAWSETVEGRGWLTVEVSDRGAGLPPDVLTLVFDRFFKADAARTRSAGSGLGLAIAQENARLHGGAITVANRPDGGAAFTLRMPLDAAPTQDRAPAIRG